MKLFKWINIINIINDLKTIIISKEWVLKKSIEKQ